MTPELDDRVQAMDPPARPDERHRAVNSKIVGSVVIFLAGLATGFLAAARTGQVTAPTAEEVAFEVDLSETATPPRVTWTRAGGGPDLPDGIGSVRLTPPVELEETIYMAATLYDRTSVEPIRVELWSTTDGAEWESTELFSGPDAFATDLDVSNGTLILTGSDRGTPTTWRSGGDSPGTTPWEATTPVGALWARFASLPPGAHTMVLGDGTVVTIAEAVIDLEYLALESLLPDGATLSDPQYERDSQWTVLDTATGLRVAELTSRPPVHTYGGRIWFEASVAGANPVALSEPLPESIVGLVPEFSGLEPIASVAMAVVGVSVLVVDELIGALGTDIDTRRWDSQSAMPAPGRSPAVFDDLIDQPCFGFDPPAFGGVGEGGFVAVSIRDAAVCYSDDGFNWERSAVLMFAASELTGTAALAAGDAGFFLVAQTVRADEPWAIFTSAQGHRWRRLPTLPVEESPRISVLGDRVVLTTVDAPSPQPVDAAPPTIRIWIGDIERG